MTLMDTMCEKYESVSASKQLIDAVPTLAIFAIRWSSPWLLKFGR